MRATTSLVLIGAAIAAPARADRYRGAASLEYEAGYVHAYERDEGSGSPDGLGLAGARLRGQIGSGAFGYRVGADLRAGSTAPGGFAYDVGLYLAGIGARLGDWSRFGVTAGVGASGATGTIDDAVQLPVEAMLELALGERLRVLGRGRIAWLGFADARQGGAGTLPWGDELEAQLAIRLGHRWTDHGYPVGNGYYVGVNFREAEGARMIGAVIGHSLDAATR